MGPIQTAVGFELVDSELRVAVVQSRFGKLRLARTHQIAEFEKLSDEARKSSIAALVKEHGLQHAKAFLTLPRRLGLIRQSELPVEIGDRVRSTIELQIESLSPWSADEIYWDCVASPSGPSGKAARTIKVTTAIIPRSVLGPWLSLFKSAGLPLSGAALSALAHAHAAAIFWQSDPSTILLSCEPSRMDGVVLRDGAVAAFSTDEIGGGEWVSDPKPALSKILSLCKLKATDDARLVVFGRNASLVQPGESVALPIEGAEKSTPSTFGPISAALLGLRNSAFSVNLVPQAERFQRNQLLWVPTYSLIALGVVLVLAALLSRPYGWRYYAASLDYEIEKLAPAVQEVSAQEAEWSAVNEKYRALRTRLDARDLNLETLRELSRILPPDCWLATYVSQGRNVTVSGFAQSASAIQKILEESPLFEEVQFAASVTRDASGKDRFTIKALVVGVPQ